MDKVFEVYAASEDSNEDRYAVLSLPATPYELLDVLDITQVKNVSDLYVQIEEYHRFQKLTQILDGPLNLNLCELNALAQKLSELDELQSISFEGMVNMELEKREPFGLPRLIDFAHSTDCCDVLMGVTDDSSLGRFYAESGFVRGLDELPDKVFELLDFRKIGAEMRQGDCGVFTDDGYVTQHSEFAEVFKDLDLAIKTPDYTVLLEISKGRFNCHACGSDKTVLLPLPSSLAAMDAALTAVGGWDWREAGFRCLDCRVPALDELISDANVVAADINYFAQKLANTDSSDLNTYKALLEALPCHSLSSAELLADTLDQYVCSPQIASPYEMALAELETIISKDDAERLIPHLNMYAYGQALLDRFGGVLTTWGIIERQDGQPVQSVTDRQPRQGGMEMM